MTARCRAVGREEGMAAGRLRVAQQRPGRVLRGSVLRGAGGVVARPFATRHRTPAASSAAMIGHARAVRHHGVVDRVGRPTAGRPPIGEPWRRGARPPAGRRKGGRRRTNRAGRRGCPRRRALRATGRRERCGSGSTRWLSAIRWTRARTAAWIAGSVHCEVRPGSCGATTKLGWPRLPLRRGPDDRPAVGRDLRDVVRGDQRRPRLAAAVQVQHEREAAAAARRAVGLEEAEVQLGARRRR